MAPDRWDAPISEEEDNPASCEIPPTRPPPPLEDASLLSRITFSWPAQTLRVGLTKALEDSDLPSLLEEDTSRYNGNHIERLWENELERAAAEVERRKAKGKKNCGIFHTTIPSLFRAIFVDYFRSTWIAQILLVVSMAARLGQSLALGLLIEQFTPSEEPRNTKMAYAWACTLIGCGLLFLFCKQMQFFITHRKGFTLKVGLLAVIYDKALRLSSVARTLSSGQVINLASNDVERYLTGAPTMLYFVYAPIESLAILGTGIAFLGPAFCAGFALMLIFVPLQLFLSRKFASLRFKVAGLTDARVNLVGQAVIGARVMKMNAWEGKFAERIAAAREMEMQKIVRASRFKALNEAVSFSTTAVVSVVMFSCHVWMGGTLTSRAVFSSLSLINLLQSSLTRIFSNAVMHLSECYASSRRLQSFLRTPDKRQFAQIDRRGVAGSRTGNDEPIISLSGATCYWDESSRYGTDAARFAAVRDISLQLYSGKLYCVVGPVGSSKSALLLALAGELPLHSGTIGRRPRSESSRFVSFAQQDPFIVNGSVLENILFGLDFDASWYAQVIEACGLASDLDQLQAGDLTIVGDRGVQLSGGQRARIGLARAIYRDAEVVLLDDPLSAVDAKVGRHIFYNAIMKLCVARGKCVVLATHQHQFVGESECTLLIDGSVQCQGSYAACIDAAQGELSSAFQTSEDEAEAAEVKNSAADSRQYASQESNSAKAAKAKETTPDRSEKEDRNTGIIGRETWRAYVVAMGGLLVGILLATVFCAAQASHLLTIAYLGMWAEESAEEQSSTFWIGLLYGLAGLVVAISLVRTRLTYQFCLKASQRLHDDATESVLRAKVAFYDTNPTGRILNRFSADVGIADDQLPLTLVDFLVGFFMALGSVATTIVTLPMVLCAIPPLLWYFVRLRRVFVTTTRELKRLEGLARSPIYAMIGEALAGVATMRANDAVSVYQEKFTRQVDQYSRAYFAFIASSRWFALRMDFVAFLLVAATSLLSVLVQNQQWISIDPAILGMALALLLQTAGTNFPWMIRQSAEVVNHMISVERISEYGHLPPEAPLHTEFDDIVGDSWPRDPSIAVKDLSVRYRKELPPALADVSFRVESGLRIGVCGRTGSGKSSLVQSLFRLLEAEEGSIEIGGVNIAKLGLHKLRQNISVIPQSPVLFAGTSVRFNLDPFDAYDDATIRSALTDAQILTAVDALPKGIHTIVAESGSNFSQGQRQLICLARAILRKSKILVLDEASANIDHRTDVLLQQAVAKSFGSATILTVAHRLDSIIECDRILVLGDGKVLEYGPPQELLDLEDHFASMVESTGKEMARSLKKSASRKSLS